MKNEIFNIILIIIIILFSICIYEMLKSENKKLEIEKPILDLENPIF